MNVCQHCGAPHPEHVMNCKSAVEPVAQWNNQINIAQNHLRHPERVSLKVLLWARHVVQEYERQEKQN